MTVRPSPPWRPPAAPCAEPCGDPPGEPCAEPPEEPWARPTDPHTTMNAAQIAVFRMITHYPQRSPGWIPPFVINCHHRGDVPESFSYNRASRGKRLRDPDVI